MTNSAESPIESAVGTAGSVVTDAFECLSNETRLAILLALWEAYEPFDDSNVRSFSALRERVGMADSGQFNYHLEKLEGHFVESTDEGYRLREAGLKFVRSIVAGAGIEDSTLEPTPIDMQCGLCGGPVEVGYENEHVYNRCTECEGLYALDETREGGLSDFALEPAGLTGRTPEELYAAAWVRGFQRLYNMIEGVCSVCSGPVEGTVAICEEHDDDGVCETCGRQPAVAAQFRCAVCKDWAVSTLGTVAKYHPAVVAFHYDHGVQLQYGVADLDRINHRLETGETDWELVAEDPIRVRVTTRIGEDEITVVLDEELSVVDVRE